MDYLVKDTFPDISNYNNLNISDWQKWISLEKDDSDAPLNNTMDEIIEYFAELGDVQTCVSLFIVRKYLFFNFTLGIERCL